MNSGIIHHLILCQHLQTWSRIISVLPLHFGTFSLQQWNFTTHHLIIKKYFRVIAGGKLRGRRVASLSRWQRRRREAPWYQIFLECVTVSGRPRGRTLGLHRKHMWVEHLVRESRYKGATETRHLHTRCSTATCNGVVNYRRKSQQSTVQPLPHHGYQRQHSSSHHPLGFRAGWWVPFNLFTFVFICFLVTWNRHGVSAKIPIPAAFSFVYDKCFKKHVSLIFRVHVPAMCSVALPLCARWFQPVHGSSTGSERTAQAASWPGTDNTWRD